MVTDVFTNSSTCITISTYNCVSIESLLATTSKSVTFSAIVSLLVSDSISVYYTNTHTSHLIAASKFNIIKFD